MHLHAYIVSLKDASSNELLTLSKRLATHGFTVHNIKGVAGAEMRADAYFRLTRHWYHLTGTLLTPGELGCTLSHQKAYRLAAEMTGAYAHLILEDDVIVSDEALSQIVRLANTLQPETYFHFGGQEGVYRQYRFIRANPVHQPAGAFVIQESDLPFIKRTVGYLIDSLVAQKLAHLIDQGAFIIDDLAYAKKNQAFEKVLFHWLVSHPLDASTSTIEQERIVSNTFSKSKSLQQGCFQISESKRKKLLWIWRKITTPRNRFLMAQQNGNQKP